MATQDNYIKTAFRLPRELHGEIMAAAESKGRSLNAEIIDRLQNSGSPENSSAITALAYRIAQLEVELQSKQLDIAELANSLASAVHEIEDGARVEDLDTQPDLKKWQNLVAKFNLSVSELQELGRLTDARFDALKAAAAQMHRVPSKKTS